MYQHLMGHYIGPNRDTLLEAEGVGVDGKDFIEHNSDE